MEEKRDLGDLPQLCLDEIASRVAEHSLENVFGLKKLCKSFFEAAECQQVKKKIKLDNVPIEHWRPQQKQLKQFLEECMKEDNPNAKFREGMKLFWSNEDTSRGVDLLYEAFLLGHKDAAYVNGMNMLCGREEYQILGLLDLNKFKRHNPTWDVEASRESVRRRLGEMYVHFRFSANQFVFNCWKRGHTLQRVRLMDTVDDDALKRCYCCSWYRELLLFCRMFNVNI